MTSSVWVPIDPVDPRMMTFFTHPVFHESAPDQHQSGGKHPVRRSPPLVDQTMPWAMTASATLMKPAMLAPTT